MEWFYADESRQQTAVDESELPALIEGGRIDPGTLVWNETMTDWRPAREARPDLFGLDSEPPALTPSQKQPTGSPLAGMPQQTAPASGMAITSMVLGIVGLLSMLGFPPCAPIFSLPAVICGHIARKQARQETLPSANAGLAMAGLVTGYIGLAIGILIIVLFGAIFGVAALSGEFEA